LDHGFFYTTKQTSKLINFSNCCLHYKYIRNKFTC
jgi:hypothetical protein